ncbi:hypothetical protein LEP1GSC052_2676 [Leptospira kmetyi serovar Malaysia str. Bejo-Iso9]|nr:hypothetical protein LEP1GSC052_2676 [Leptospira kmetyi serovar Malaysia str. Bejo-Iso9]
MMNNVRKYGMILTPALALLLSVANCVTALGNVTITGKNYPALTETDHIEVIMRAVPDYKVEQIGLVEVRCAQLNYCVEYVKGKAREVGADVIILANTGTVTTVSTQPGSHAGNASTPGHVSYSSHQVQTWEISKKVISQTPSKPTKGKKSVSEEI